MDLRELNLGRSSSTFTRNGSAVFYSVSIAERSIL